MTETAAAQKRKILRAMLMVAFYWFSLYVYTPYQATYLKDLGAGQTMIGLIAGAYGLAQIILRPPLGIIADLKGGTFSFMLAGVAIPAAASIVRLIAPAAGGFLTANLISGCGAAMWICFMVYFADLFGKDGMQQATALIMGANGCGQLLGYLLSTLTYRHFGMAFLCQTSILASLLATGLALTLRPERRPRPVAVNLAGGSREEPPATAPTTTAADRRPSLKDLLKVVSNKRLLVFSIFGVMQTGIALATVTNIDTQRIRELGAGQGQVGAMTVVFMAFQMIFSMWSASPGFRRFGSRLWLPASLAAAGLYCLLSPLATAPLHLFLVQVFSGFYAGVITSYALSEATAEIPQDMRTTAVGIYQCAVAVGIALLPFLSGLLADISGSLLTPYYVFAAVSLLSAALAVWATRTSRLSSSVQA